MTTQNLKPSKPQYDVALLGVWFGSNYGSLLNGYSVYKILNMLKKSVLMIHKIDAKPGDKEINETHNARFIMNYYPKEDISPIYSFDQLTELNDYCDTFIVGSDQVWEYHINKFFHMAFFLGFVNDEKRKISFGTSFGHSKDITPMTEQKEAKRCLRRFQAISVRELSGVDICREVYGVKAKSLIEPVFCVDKEEFDHLAKESTINETSPYILTYILDPSPEKRKLIKNYEEQSKKKVINILDGQPSTYKTNSENLDLPNTFTGIGAEDFLKLYQNADFIITDSFHGTAFSIIYNKPFLSIANHKRGVTRFENLLKRFGLMNRLIDEKYIPVDLLNYMIDIDYSLINKQIQKEKKEALTWLENALNTPVSYPSPVEYRDVTKQLDPLMCSGCSACINICPKKAISLKPDEWGYYRSSVNYDLCVNCGKCADICPEIKLPLNHNSAQPDCYAFATADNDVLMKSSSGGIFTTMAREILRQNGCVAGAAWRDDLSVEHIIIDKEEDLWKLQKSKYLQSDMGNIFRNVRTLLEQGRKVLFTGTPCQAAGLRAYLGKDYENLLIVDLLCGNAPSAGFFKKYIQETTKERVRRYEFRYKPDYSSWDANHVLIEYENGEIEIRNGSAEDYFQRVYHNHTMCSVHCEKCKFQAFPRMGDLTIGDFWWIEKHDPTISTGTSLILLNNQKGTDFFISFSEGTNRISKKVPIEWMGGNGHSLVGGKNWCSPQRDLFYSLILTHSFTESVNIVYLNRCEQLKRENDKQKRENDKLKIENDKLKIENDKLKRELKAKDAENAALYSSESWKFGNLLIRPFHEIKKLIGKDNAEGESSSSGI